MQPTDKSPPDDEELRNRLSPEQYQVCMCSATEAPFTGQYWDCKDVGTYQCICCETPLFTSAAKFDSGTGWPSFSDSVKPEAVGFRDDLSQGMARVEIFCNHCGSHLGHVFDDGPPPTGKRYCVNSASLKLVGE